MFSQISDRTQECESILGRLPIKGRDGIAADKEALLNSKYNEDNATCEKVSDKKRRGATRPRTQVSCRSDVPVRCTVLAHLSITRRRLKAPQLRYIVGRKREIGRASQHRRRLIGFYRQSRGGKGACRTQWGKSRKLWGSLFSSPATDAGPRPHLLPLTSEELQKSQRVDHQKESCDAPGSHKCD